MDELERLSPYAESFGRLQSLAQNPLLHRLITLNQTVEHYLDRSLEEQGTTPAVNTPEFSTETVTPSPLTFNMTEYLSDMPSFELCGIFDGKKSALRWLKAFFEWASWKATNYQDPPLCISPTVGHYSLIGQVH